MSHYEARLDRDLSVIREKLADLSSHIARALEDGIRALFSNDNELAYKTILGDLPINRASRELDKLCHRFFAVHLPSAGLLRFVSSVMRANIELERVGDYATTICRESVQLDTPPGGTIGRQIERLAEGARSTLHQALASFQEEDTDQALRDIVLILDVRRDFEAVFQGLMAEETSSDVRERFCFLVIFSALQRVVDQAKNICEETIFAVTGKTKPPKTYRILFLDGDNSALGPMAQAIAQKNFPEGGSYRTAGGEAAAVLNTGLSRFLEERGVELVAQSPEALDPATDLGEYHVIVSLQGPVSSYVKTVPFHTVALEWEVGEPPAASESEDTTRKLKALYRALAMQVQDLMETMHGEEAH